MKLELFVNNISGKEDWQFSTLEKKSGS